MSHDHSKRAPRAALGFTLGKLEVPPPAEPLIELRFNRVMRRPEVQRVTGLSRSSIYRGMASEDFPRAISLSKKSVGWLASDIEAWLAARVAASRPNQEN